METQQKKGCGCGGNNSSLPEKIVAENFHKTPWNESQRGLADLIRAVHQRRQKIRST